MSIERNKAIVRRLYEEVWNDKNLAVVAEVDGANVFDYLEGFTAMMRGAFPDFRITVEDLVAEGEKVVVRWTGRGTHKGMYQSRTFGMIPPTGKEITFKGIEIYRIVDGKIVDEQAEVDNFSLFQQLNVIPAAPRTAS